MEYAIAFVVLAIVVALVVTLPLRRPAAPAREDSLRIELETAKQAKYREIRDAELDYRMGKLSEADWGAIDRDLRAEAAEILRRLDELDG